MSNSFALLHFTSSIVLQIGLAMSLEKFPYFTIAAHVTSCFNYKFSSVLTQEEMDV